MRLALRLSSSLLILGLAACSTTGSTPPKGEKISNDNYHGYYKIGQPYKIGDKWFYPKEQPAYNQTGIASWYGSDFHGKKTANGDTFDKYAITGAHNTLPLPSMVRVTNLENDKTLIVMVNDRGPFSKGRIIDLSERAAELLGFKQKGVANVRVQFLPGQTQRLISNLPKEAERKNFAFFGKTTPVYADQVVDPTETAPLSMKDDVTTNSPGIHTLADKMTAPMPMVARAEPANFQKQTPTIVTNPAGTYFPPVTDATPMDNNEPAKMDITDEPESLENAAANLESVTKDWVAEGKKSPDEAAKPVASKPHVIPGVQLPAEDETPEIVSEVPGHFIQAGTYSVKGNAERSGKMLRGIADVSIKSVSVNNKTLYRVRLGPIQDMKIAQLALEKVIKMGHPDAVLLNETLSQ